MKTYYDWLMTESNLIEEAKEMLKNKQISLINAGTLSFLSADKQKKELEKAKSLSQDRFREFVAKELAECKKN
jgi:hypothetical protein